LKQLQFLWLSNAALTGPIPTEVGELRVLSQLDLGHNRLNATIPTELGSLNILEQLDLSDNALTGSIPISVSSFYTWRFDGNRLTGSVPSQVCESKLSQEQILGHSFLDLVVNCEEVACDCNCTCAE
jgi:hypothetical protein